MPGADFIRMVEADTAALTTAVEAVRTLQQAAFCQRSGDELLEYLRELEQLSRLVFAVQVRAVDEVDQRGLAATFACSSTRSLLQQVLSIPAAEATSRVKAAQATLPRDLASGEETPSQLPVLAAAVDAGLIDPDHVRTTVASMGELPNRLDEAERAEAEQALVQMAMDLHPDQFRKAAHHLVDVIDPDGRPDPSEPESRAEFTVGTRSASTGLTRVSGRFDDVSVEVLRTSIDGLSAPRPLVEGVRDPRSVATRRAHALIEVLNRSLRFGELPAHGGERPQITVTVPWQVVEQQVGVATLGSGETVNPATVRRLLCDASLLPAVLGTEGEVLDLGRSARTFNRATRRALALRDRGCSFPGCDRPPTWCDSHHVKWWERDCGDTSVHNGCLLCAFHHSLVHKGEWTMQMSSAGIPEFIPPKWIDPTQRPRSNTVHLQVPDTS